MVLSQPILGALSLVAVTLSVPPPSHDGAAFLRPVAALAMVWQVKREEGTANAPRRCTVATWTREISASLRQDPATGDPATGAAVWSLRVGRDNQPGSLRYLRVGRAIFQTDRPRFLGAEAARIVALLKAPGVFAFEWARRPDHAKGAGLYGTGDFAAKAALCEAWVRGPPV